MLLATDYPRRCTILFPQLGPQYYDEKHKDVLARMESFYAESITINQSFWGEADTDWRFFSGDQTLWNDLYGNLPANRRRQFNFNRIRRVVNMISGHERRNRKSIVVVPIENADNETADQFTKVLMWCVEQESMLETMSEAFEGALVGGMNLIQLWMDYRSDPVSGNIKMENCSYNSFLIDPYFKKTDLSDCNAIWKRSFLTKRECISLLPENTDEILGLIGQDSGTGRDGKFQFMPESYNYGMKNLLTYDEFYYRDYRTQKMMVDTETGETMEWKSSDKVEELSAFLETYPQVTMIEQDITTVRLAIVVQGKVMYDGPNPSGSDLYPFVPVLGYYAPQMPYFPWRIQGVVRGLRDAQYLYNRRKIIELDILESQINSGWIYKENALVNPNDIFLSEQGKGLAVKADAAMTDVIKIPCPGIDPSLIQLSEILGKEMNEISGVSDELLGSSDDKNTTGILAKIRQGAGLTTLQVLFDQFDRSKKYVGRVMIDMIQANFVFGKIQKILEGEQPAPQFYNKAFGKYNANVEEGMNTDSQRQMQFAQMLQLKEMGLPISPGDLLEAATFQNKDRVIKNLEKAEAQQAQMQQEQHQVQMAFQQAQMQAMQAKSEADKGLAVERESRVFDNYSLAEERRHKANQEDSAAMLDKIKAIKELETMDLSHIEMLVNMANSLKEQENLAAETATGKTAPE